MPGPTLGAGRDGRREEGEEERRKTRGDDSKRGPNTTGRLGNMGALRSRMVIYEVQGANMKWTEFVRD